MAADRRDGHDDLCRRFHVPPCPCVTRSRQQAYCRRRKVCYGIVSLARAAPGSRRELATGRQGVVIRPRDPRQRRRSKTGPQRCVAREEGTLEHAGVCAVWPDAIVTSDVPSGPQVIHMEITRGAESGQEEP